MPLISAFFKEPKSWDGDVGRCSMQPVRDSKRPMSSVLRDLEAADSPFLAFAPKKCRTTGNISIQ